MSTRLGDLLFRFRGFIPVLPILYAVVFAAPAMPWLAVGVGAMVVGESLRLWAAAHVGPTVRTSVPLAHQLITAGPYAHTRHPLYLGNFLLATGYATASGAGWPVFPLVVGILFVALYGRHARREEVVLAAAFPPAWDAYVRVVPRFGWRPTAARVPGAGAAQPVSALTALRVEALTLNAIVWVLVALWLRTRGESV